MTLEIVKAEEEPAALFAEIADPRKRAVLIALSFRGRNSLAYDDVGVPERTFYQWLEDDQEFAAACARAKTRYGDRVIAEVHRRAIDGWDEEVYGKDSYLGTKRRYSDELLGKLVGAVAPKEFGTVGQRHQETAGVRVEISGDVALALLQRADRLLAGELGAVVEGHVTVEGQLAQATQPIAAESLAPARAQDDQRQQGKR